jgi:hypothetical protein
MPDTKIISSQMLAHDSEEVNMLRILTYTRDISQ